MSKRDSEVYVHVFISRSAPVRLAHSVFGQTPHMVGPLAPLVILHGLFGSGKNWRSLAHRLAANINRPVYAVDARNHGESPHTPDLSYDLMTSDVVHFCQSHSLEKIVLMGHSMGGKTAMMVALTQPLLVDRLVVLDSSPRASPDTGNTRTLLKSLQQLNLSSVANRREADAALKEAIPDKIVREFLLTNLMSDPSTGQLHWRANLDAIEHYMHTVKAGIPLGQDLQPFNGPTLFLGGNNSSYITSRDVPAIQHLFPAAQVKHIVGAGHWIHFEKPLEFLKHVTDFIMNSSE